MSPTEYLIAIAICGTGAALYFWSQRLVKNKTAEAKRIGNYNENKAAATSAAVYLIVGVIVIGVMLFNWNRVPEENTGFAIAFIGLGAALILYGIIRWYRARRANQD